MAKKECPFKINDEVYVLNYNKRDLMPYIYKTIIIGINEGPGPIFPVVAGNWSQYTFYYEFSDENLHSVEQWVFKTYEEAKIVAIKEINGWMKYHKNKIKNYTKKMKENEEEFERYQKALEEL